MRVPLVVLAVLALLALGTGLLRHHYASWHPCDWLLQDAVARTLQRQGIDPEAASVPLKASTVGSEEVQARMRGRITPLRCLGSWAVRRVRL
jgi:hypothetical protein